MGTGKLKRKLSEEDEQEKTLKTKIQNPTESSALTNTIKLTL